MVSLLRFNEVAMTYPAVTVAPVMPDGSKASLTIVQTGPDTASLNLQSTPVGGTPTQEGYRLSHIRSDGTKIVAQGPSFLFVTPQITFELSAPPQQSAATMTVSHALMHNGSTVFPLSQDDHDGLAAFLKTAVFPPPSVP
jgi:hypothetical protein